MMDETGGWGHYHKWRRLQKENKELKEIIRKLNGENYLLELEKKKKEEEEDRKVKAELRKLKLNKI